MLAVGSPVDNLAADMLAVGNPVDNLAADMLAVGNPALDSSAYFSKVLFAS